MEFGPLQLPAADASAAGVSLLCSRGLTGTAALIYYGQASLDPLLQRFLHSLLTLGSNCRKSINLEDLFQFVQFPPQAPLPTKALVRITQAEDECLVSLEVFLALPRLNLVKI